MGGSILSPDHVRSSHILASKWSKMAYFGSLCLFHVLQTNFLIKITVKIWGRVITVWIHLDPAIFGPQNSSKWPKMAYFGSFAHSVDHFFDKNNYKYKGEGHFSLDPLGSNNVRASKQLKTGQNGLFWQFSPI